MTSIDFQQTQEQLEAKLRILKSKKKLMKKLKHSWNQFFSLGSLQRLGYLVKEHQLVRYGSILSKVLFDKHEEGLYQHISLKFIDQVIDHGFIPKNYQPG